MANYDDSNKIKITADNGGGVALHITNSLGQVYEHFYNDPNQAADDLVLALSGEDPMEWDNNEVGTIDNADFDQNDTIEANSPHDIVEWGVDTAWHNIAVLAEVVGKAFGYDD